MTTLAPPSIEFSLLAPMIIVLAAAVVGVLVESFAPAAARRTAHLVLSIGSMVAALIAVVLLAGTSSIAVAGSVVIDGPALFLQGVILLVSIASVLLMAQRSAESGSSSHVDAFTPQASTVPGSVAEARAAQVTRTEIYPLAMFAVGGMMLFPASNDLLTMFVALEVLSLPLYLLCGLARRRRLLSQEASLKYFLLGAFSSAFFLFGTALLYGFAGTVEFGGIAEAAADPAADRTLAVLGTGLIAVGLLFKVGAVPFHAWTPDVYQGAPTPVTAFMASATKVAAFGALLRIFTVAVPSLQDEWRPMLMVIALATMVVGAVVAVTQTDVKRMLAYSSVAHAGFILTGIVAANDAGVAAVLFYLAAYAFSTLGAFAVLALVRDADGEVTELSRWAGIGRRSPLVATSFALFLLAFAGIPLTSGFTSKFAVFQAALEGGAAPLVIVGVLSSAVAASFYMRVVVIMFFTDDAPNSARVGPASAGTTVTIGVATVVTVVLGVFPQPILDLAADAAALLR